MARGENQKKRFDRMTGGGSEPLSAPACRGKLLPSHPQRGRCRMKRDEIEKKLEMLSQLRGDTTDALDIIKNLFVMNDEILIQ